MKYVKNSYLSIIIFGIFILCIGLIIGLNINKKEVYTKVDMVASSKDTLSNKEIEVIGDTFNAKEEQVSNNEVNNTNNVSKSDDTNSNYIENNNKNILNNDASEVIKYSSNDEVVINSLENSLKNINNGDTSSKSFADSAKGVFVSIVDFLFYDGEINGVTFNELTDSGKQKVLEIANKIDKAIESKIPGYKETISSGASNAFNKASEVIKNGANNLNNFAKDKLGEENYQSIIDAKDELVYYTKNAINLIGDGAGKVFNSVKDKVSGWYQEFKKN